MADARDDDAVDEDEAKDEDAALERIDPAFLLPLIFDPLGGPDARPSTSPSGPAARIEPTEDEPPFLSDADLRLFRLAAAQTGLALENSQLLAQVAAEIAAREKHKRELEIARDVQQRLFPQDHPPVAGLDYAGACRPALEVGGDYYDFLTISDREFGIAIGDVSGKGIPASLLMATLRAYLRGQAAAIRPSAIRPSAIRPSAARPGADRATHRRTSQEGTNDLPSLMTNLNRFVYDSSLANRYATFFYAEHDAVTRVLTYVNAGHNPPLLFRAAGRHIADGGDAHPIRLNTGGPVIGLLPECAYARGQVTLHPGDLLIAFTDGISEAINRTDEEWGEARLIDAIHRCRDASPDALIAQIMGSVDAFVADAPQYDDMTLIVVRAV